MVIYKYIYVHTLITVLIWLVYKVRGISSLVVIPEDGTKSYWVYLLKDDIPKGFHQKRLQAPSWPGRVTKTQKKKKVVSDKKTYRLLHDVWGSGLKADAPRTDIMK